MRRPPELSCSAADQQLCLLPYDGRHGPDDGGDDLGDGAGAAQGGSRGGVDAPGPPPHEGVVGGPPAPGLRIHTGPVEEVAVGAGHVHAEREEEAGDVLRSTGTRYGGQVTGLGCVHMVTRGVRRHSWGVCL